MKIVIIGSGIAGLAMARMLQTKGHEVVLNERQGGVPVKGNAFLVNEEGMKIICSLDPGKEVPGLLTKTFHRFSPNGRIVSSQQMDNWFCTRRSDLILHLTSLVAKDSICYGRVFSHFLHKGDRVIAAVFQNGEIEYGDVFVGADGSRSSVREKIFGTTKFSPVEVREILGIAKHPILAKSRKGIFSKFQCNDKGLSFGFIPVSDEELVWFSQMDVSLAPETPAGAAELASYTKALLSEFQEPVHELLEATDFSSAYVWNTTDFDTLPSFHQSNVVLIGDAAHMAVPFTSAGVTNALQDARVLVDYIASNDEDLQLAFNEYYRFRMPVVHEHLLAGRNMKKMFVNPMEDVKIFNLSMVPKQPMVEIKRTSDPCLEVLYFTDPICSTCWTIQPQLRKIKMEYSGKMEFRYLMSGLLPGWQGFERNGIKGPVDVAQHWEEASEESGMPIDGSIWIDDPLQSSFPPSRAFKAAQIQNQEKALAFLRKLNESVFMEKKNITSLELIGQLADEVGLDKVQILKDMESNGADMFNNDLKTAASLEVSFLPTIVFKMDGKVLGKLSGSIDYDSLRNIIRQLDPIAYKKTIDLNPRQVFDAYASLTTREFSFIMGLGEPDAELTLQNLEIEGLIKKVSSSKGAIWVNSRKSTAA